METWSSVAAFFLAAWASGFAFASCLYFASFFVSVRWTEFWTGRLKD